MMHSLKCLLWLLSAWVFCGEPLEKGRKPRRHITATRRELPSRGRAALGSPRIVDGTAVDASVYPWISSLNVYDANCAYVFSNFCGGSIFDTTTDGKSWLLTAAHCLDGLQADIDDLNSQYDCDLKLHADITRDDIDDNSETGYSRIEMMGWKMHEEYDSNTLENDVAIAWSNDQLSIDPVPLQTTSPCCAVDDVLRVIGYGADYSDGPPTATLEYVDLYYVEYDTCETMLDENYQYRDHLRVGMFCAYDVGKDSCQGDSGGPMIQGSTSDSPQVGVVSWGYGCADEGLPGIYTDVGYYYDWILDAQIAAIAQTTAEPQTTAGLILCDDGCEIQDSYLNDDWCDCTQCEDEDNWNCDACGSCPATCGLYVQCTGTPLTTSGPPQTTKPQATTTEPQTTAEPFFMCDDGCEIQVSFVNDDWCDCTQCEDEPNWNCDACSNCPDSCGTYVECTGTPLTTTAPPQTTKPHTTKPQATTAPPQSTKPQTTAAVFECDDGCEILESFTDDGWCDCTQCEDESQWSCGSCPGCPSTCDGYIQCVGVSTEAPSTEGPTTEGPTIEGPTTEKPASTEAVFTCDDGCEISEAYTEDDWCDCSNCEDESQWTCDSCPECPSECGDFVECVVVTSAPPTTVEPTAEVPTTEVPATTEAVFLCDDGCDIRDSYLNDDWCDCTQCEDESQWNCDACGGCPDTCGGYVECAGTPLPTTAPPQTTEGNDTRADGCAGFLVSHILVLAAIGVGLL